MLLGVEGFCVVVGRGRGGPVVEELVLAVLPAVFPLRPQLAAAVGRAEPSLNLYHFRVFPVPGFVCPFYLV